MKQTNNKLPSMDQILEEIMATTDHGKITVGEIVEHLRNRGFGPFLAVLGFLAITIGSIPFVPLLIGVIIIFVNIQMLINKEQPWLPKKIKSLKIDKKKLQHGIDIVKPYTKKIERMLKMRWLFLFSRLSEVITAIACIILSLTMIFIGFIPMLPAILSLPIFLFGIGYIAQDGLLIAIGFLIMLGICTFILLQMFPNLIA